ncbi:MAG: sigma-70 family RNA polymerase sigma factor [Clostridia bacterium]|nr:sigma-70 family RNA polymerase sigma factor [Clostridia bacterium]
MDLSQNNKILADSRGDVRELLLAYRGGDEVAFDSLIKIYHPLIDSMSDSCYLALSAVCEREDVVQDALIAFSKAAISYNIEQDKVSFGLYAKICIGNALVSRVRAVRRKHIEILPIDGIFDMADPEDISNGIIENENIGQLYELIKSTLSDFEYKVFRLVASGCSSSEIADRLGKTEKSVDNAIFRARNKLRSVLDESSKR